MKVQPSVKIINQKTNKLVRRKGKLYVVVQKGTNDRTPGQKRYKQRQG